MREVLFLAILALAAACVVVGVSFWSAPLAWIAAGVLLAVLGWLGLSGGSDAAEAGGDE